MQKCRHQTLVVHVHGCQYGCNCERVGYIGFAGLAELALVGLLSKVIGLSYLRNLLLVEVLIEIFS